MTAGGRKYFTCAYLNIRLIRDTLRSSLPIEVFYAGANELPFNAIEYMESTFAHVKFVDITRMDANLKHLQWKGLTSIKIFAVYFSSFQQVLFLDADNYPRRDPTPLFDLQRYQEHGALFWPDYCNMRSSRLEMWDMFGIARPSSWPHMHPSGPAYVWTSECDASVSEIESGQMLLDKARVWKGLSLTVFVAINANYFLESLIEGDKQSFSFCFNATGTPYAMVPLPPYHVGLLGKLADNTTFFCGNTMGQRHPETGVLVFLHRNSVKFPGTYEFLQFDPIPRAWTHYALQNASSSSRIVHRREAPEQVMFPNPNVQAQCVHPEGEEAIVLPIDEDV